MALPLLSDSIGAGFRRCFPPTSPQTFHLTDYNRPLERDEDLAEQPAGAVLCVAHGAPGELSTPGQEVVSFQPHPKTLTMAGDYEYFAAQARKRGLLPALVAAAHAAPARMHKLHKPLPGAREPRSFGPLPLTATVVLPSAGPTPICLRPGRVHRQLPAGHKWVWGQARHHRHVLPFQHKPQHRQGPGVRGGRRLRHVQAGTQ